jgi:hypothetical protein
MEYIELVEKCKLVHTRSEPNGHDCWGKYEFTIQKYVWINGKMKDVYDGFYVIHDGKDVKETISSKFLLDCRQREKEHFEKTGFETPREYAAYLKGREEIENNEELLQEKIMELRTKKLKSLKK